MTGVFSILPIPLLIALALGIGASLLALRTVSALLPAAAGQRQTPPEHWDIVLGILLVATVSFVFIAMLS
jgi:hypothetical protein